MSGVRTLALVDGEHYPPVVRAAIDRASHEQDVVAALLLGGREKLDGVPDYGVPLEQPAEGEPWPAAMVAAARRHSVRRVLDLSDEPVVGQAGAGAADLPRPRGRARVCRPRLPLPPPADGGVADADAGGDRHRQAGR